MVARYPHTGLLSWQSAERQNATTGILTPGTLATLAITCRAEPGRIRAARYEAGADGDQIKAEYRVFTAPFSTTIADGATFALSGEVFRVVAIEAYQRHTEILVTR